MPAVIDIKSGAPTRGIRYQLAGYKILIEENWKVQEGHPHGGYVAWDDASVEFDEASHIYRIRKTRVPSVTQALNSVGLSQVSDFVSDEALWWGTQIHEMVRLFHMERLDEESLDPLLGPRLEGYKLFVQDYGFKFLGGERPLGSRRYGFAGKPDLYGLTSLDENDKSGHVRRYSVHLAEDGKYRALEYKEHSDVNVFLHAAAVEQEKLRIGLSK